MWDAKRQAIWLTTALALATFVVYREAIDEQTGRLDFGYFALLEIIFLLVIVAMFYIYSRNSSDK
jgi:cell division protein FtsW (lipid II flippase)